MIGMAGKILGDNLPKGEAGLDQVAERVEVLIRDGRLLAQGNIKKWRYSEVRKPDSNLRTTKHPPLLDTTLLRPLSLNFAPWRSYASERASAFLCGTRWGCGGPRCSSKSKS